MARLSVLLASALVVVTASAAHAQSGLISKVGLPVTNPGETVKMSPTTPMFCLATSGSQGSAVTIRSCKPLAPNGAVKEWAVPVKSTGPIRHVPSGLCVDARQSDQTLVLWSCHGGWNQQFTNTTADELKLASNNTCATVAYGTPRSGAAVSMTRCRGNDANQSFYRAN